MTPANVTTGAGQAAGPAPQAVPNSPLTAPTGSNGGGGGSTLLRELRAAAAAQSSEHTEDFVVGGEFGKQLWIRYKPLDSGPMDRFIAQRTAARDRMDSDPRLVLPITDMNMDMMAQGCVCVLGADKEGNNKEALSDTHGSIRLEHRLAVLLELPLPEGNEMYTAREVIMMIFGGNGMAIVDHADDVVRWMRDPSKKPDLGES